VENLKNQIAELQKKTNNLVTEEMLKKTKVDVQSLLDD